MKKQTILSDKELANKSPEELEEYLDYLDELQRDWEKNTNPFAEKVLLEYFPEAKAILPEKLNEWEAQKKELSENIKRKLITIRNSGADEGTQFFWREWIKINDGEKLIECERHIKRLKRLIWIAQGKQSKNGITEEHIQVAKQVPIQNLINHEFRQSGKVLIGLCPLHNEKHPSFYVYPETNTCWCYGCNRGGDAIELIKLIHNLNFIQAVNWLNNYE